MEIGEIQGIKGIGVLKHNIYICLAVLDVKGIDFAPRILYIRASQN